MTSLFRAPGCRLLRRRLVTVSLVLAGSETADWARRCADFIIDRPRTVLTVRFRSRHYVIQNVVDIFRRGRGRRLSLLSIRGDIVLSQRRIVAPFFVSGSPTRFLLDSVVFRR